MRETNQGGSYILDPKTGKRTLNHRTQSILEAREQAVKQPVPEKQADKKNRGKSNG